MEGLNDSATMTLAPAVLRSTRPPMETSCLEWDWPINSAAYGIGKPSFAEDLGCFTILAQAHSKGYLTNFRRLASRAFRERTVPAKPAERCSSDPNHESDGFTHYRSRPSLEASADVPMEHRAGAGSWQQPKRIGNLCRGTWARLASRVVIRRSRILGYVHEGEFWIYLRSTLRPKSILRCAFTVPICGTSYNTRTSGPDKFPSTARFTHE